MVVVDLQWGIFLLLCGVTFAVAGIAWALSRVRETTTRSRVRSPQEAFALVNQAPFGVLVLEATTLSYANRAAKDLLRITDDHGPLLPMGDWAELLLSDTRAARAVGTASGRSGGRYRNVTFPSGRTIRWWVAPQEDRDLVMILDITAEERAQQASRGLISDLGHELRTPIATLLTHLEILRLDDVGADVHAQSVQLARQEAQRMSRLVNDILELGRLEIAEGIIRRPTDLLALVREVRLQLMPRAKELDISLDAISDTQPPLVLGNPDRLRQVILNLLDNALKYAGQGSTVTIELTADRSYVNCTICDTGPGIAAEHLPHVTQRFYRADAPETVEGSGLGLALVTEILRRHDSHLDMTSPVRDGHGTCASFKLPLASSPYGGS